MDKIPDDQFDVVNFSPVSDLPFSEPNYGPNMLVNVKTIRASRYYRSGTNGAGQLFHIYQHQVEYMDGSPGLETEFRECTYNHKCQYQ